MSPGTTPLKAILGLVRTGFAVIAVHECVRAAWLLLFAHRFARSLALFALRLPRRCADLCFAVGHCAARAQRVRPARRLERRRSRCCAGRQPLVRLARRAAHLQPLAGRRRGRAAGAAATARLPAPTSSVGLTLDGRSTSSGSLAVSCCTVSAMRYTEAVADMREMITSRRDTVAPRHRLDDIARGPREGRGDFE